MFIQLSKNRKINLSHVSNIVLLNTKRIVFNMSYSTNVKCNDGVKELADYIYWDGYDDSDKVRLLENDYIKQNFVQFYDTNRIINKNMISSIKCDDSRKRIIINLAYGIRLKPNTCLTPDFIFVDSEDEANYEKNKIFVEML